MTVGAWLKGEEGDRRGARRDEKDLTAPTGAFEPGGRKTSTGSTDREHRPVPGRMKERSRSRSRNTEHGGRNTADGIDVQRAVVYVKPVEVVATSSIHRLCSWRSVREPSTVDRDRDRDRDRLS